MVYSKEFWGAVVVTLVQVIVAKGAVSFMGVSWRWLWFIPVIVGAVAFRQLWKDNRPPPAVP